MYKEIGLVTVKKSADRYNKFVRAIEDAGYILILTTETSTDRYYIVAESEGT